MSETLSGCHFESGTGNFYTDHVVTQTVVRPDGDRFTVAIVADGGKRDAQRGKQTAQVAVNSTLTYLKHGGEKTVPELLVNAIQSANHAVKIFDTLKKEPEPGYVPEPLCTLAVALIHNDEKLYIANVGCSRVYFLRESRLTQLTLDHSFKNINVTLGKIDYQTASDNPNADISIRSLGSGPELVVDLGFHIKPSLNLKSYALAQSRGKKGLPLQPGDAVLVCSDGLYKNWLGGSRPLIHDEEISQVLTSQAGEKAARALVSFALGRDGTDSISAAVLQIDNPAKIAMPVNHASRIRKRTALVFASITAVFLMFYFAGAYLFSQRLDPTPQPIAVSTQVAPVGERVEISDSSSGVGLSALEASLAATRAQATTDYANGIRATQTVAAIIAATQTAQPTATLVPTETPRPTLEPGQIGIFRLLNQEQAQNIREDEPIFASDVGEFQINHQGIDAEDASIYAQAGSEIEFSEVARQVEFRLFEESDILIETGLYSSGTEIEIRAEDDDLTISAADSCLAVQYSEVEQEIVAMCLRGDCEYKIGRNATQPIPTGQRMTFDPSDFSIEPKTRRIGQADSIWYEDLLANFESGARDINQCLRGYLPPPATITPTPTIFVASPTPPPQSDSSGNNGGGNNNNGDGNSGSSGSSENSNQPSLPQPSATPRPTNRPDPVVSVGTDTPATATRIPATATRRPTSTPVPPMVTLRPTQTSILPTVTSTIRPTRTPIPPTATSTIRPTRTPVPPTNTPLPTVTLLPTNTPNLPTVTPPPLPTNTLIPPTATQVQPTSTSVPSTATPLPLPTATLVPPTSTPVPPTAEPTSTPLPLPTSTPILLEPTKEPEPTQEPDPTDEPEPTEEPKATKEPKPTKEPKLTKEP